MPEKIESRRLEPQEGWVFEKRMDVRTERLDEPSILTLDAAVAWIRKNKPTLWIGSIFSVPEPSGFPSGYAITRSLLKMILPRADSQTEEDWSKIIDALVGRWPLERLLDEFEMLNYDLSESLLGFFSKHDKVANPNGLHKAVRRYYELGLAATPLCITTNWDSLIEKEFRANGFSVHTAGPRDFGTKDSDVNGLEGRSIFIYHPHGSFESRDVVCSLFRQQQLFNFDAILASRPTLFLGYSGYEPSIYRNLEHSKGQLWCIRDTSDLKIPTKRRLLCRPNTFVFVGDLQDLLVAIDALESPLVINSPELAHEETFSPKILDVVRAGLTADLDPSIACDHLLQALLGGYDEPEATIRFVRAIAAIDGHVRNRIPSSELPLALLAASSLRNDEQIWMSLIAFLLRSGAGASSPVVKTLLENAMNARGADGLRFAKGVRVFNEARSRCYRAYLGRPEREDDDPASFVLSQYAPRLMGNLSLSAEMAEISAFECLRRNELDRARGYFDTAATFFYLTGLWQAGKLNEQATKAIEAVVESASHRSLAFPF